MDISCLCLFFFHTCVFLVLSSRGLKGQFIPAGATINSISQGSTIRVSQFCGDDILCRSQLNQSKCLNLNVCEEVITCNGRDDFPPAEDPLLNKWTLNTPGSGCIMSGEKPTDVPSTLSIPENTRMLTVNGSDSTFPPCYVKRNSNAGDVFSLTFWIKTDCANCTVVDLTIRGDISVYVKVVDGDHICIDQACISDGRLQKGKWAFVALTSYKGVVTFYLDKNKVTELNLSVSDVSIGTKTASNDSVFHILHPQFYLDVLTPREIKEMVTGLLGKCRCPPDHPEVSDSQDSMCVNAKGETHPRFNRSVEFKHPEVILDESPENWASAEQGPVTLTLDFSTSYQLESIEIIFIEPPPSRVTYRLVSNGQEKDMREFKCSTTECLADLGLLDNLATKEEFRKRIAEGVKIVLQRDQNDVRSFILGRITITGRCDCNGNAASCTPNGNTYSCACDSSTNTEGPHCRSCKANFFQMPGEFDCKNSCQCFHDGVANKTDQCDESGGKCLCKEFVEGHFCDRCKPWTYNLDGRDSKGCTACPCFQSGSESCNNITGVCTCKTNVAAPNCQICLKNHYGFTMPQGCRPCDCVSAGTVKQDLTCNDNDGQCQCKKNVEGRNCGQCKAEFFNLQTPNLSGCEECDCNPVGVDNSSCHKDTGQCACRGGVITDRTCNPEIVSIQPTYGPLIGATKITIQGKLLGNYTRSVSVYLGNYIEQPITTVNDSSIIVETKQHSSLDTVDLRVRWVGMENTLKAPTSFSYLKDPILDNRRTVKGSTFVSGGCLVKLFGSNLQSVEHPRLEVRHKNNPSKKMSGPCQHIQGHVVCQTPNTNSLYSSGVPFEMSAVFDGVILYLGDIEIKPDPVIRKVGNIEFQHPFEDSISITGTNMLSACETNDYTVHIGAIQCTITHISNTDIECEPPTRKPEGPDKVPITVSIGNIQMKVGTLEYLELYETTGFIIIISCIASLIVIIIAILIVCYCYRHRRKQPSSNSAPKNAHQSAHIVNRPMNTYSELTSVTNDNAYSNGHNGTIRVESVFLEPKKGIVNTAAETSVLEDEFLPHVDPGLKADVTSCFIGGGSFAIGTLCILEGQNAKLTDGTLQRQRSTGQKLIVKSFTGTIQETLQEPGYENSPLQAWAQQVLKECLRFKKYKHNHLMHTIGICVDRHRVHILYEHMSKGPLKNVVLDTQQDYSVRKLLGFSQQVAEGIAYLASKDITHKDVASRNCMVDEYSVVKLGDASFAWDFYPHEYVYNDQRERYLPLRWMAPESIEHGYYDMRTDVWSFGVLVWELLTRGCLPFHEVVDSDVSDYILNGYILGKPETISDDLYNLLRSCWAPENEGRPSIAAVSSALCNILETDDDDSTYANMATPRVRPSSGAQFYSSTNISGV